MGVFDKIASALGLGKEQNIEEYLTTAEMENVDVLTEPADFYVKPIVLQREEDIKVVEDELQKRNIILLKITEMKNRYPNKVQQLIQSLKEYTTKINGDIALIDEGRLLLTPARVKIVKPKKKV
ncbi:MAG: cell division protein SepF [Candidatus Micrarchaeia archaeon]